MKTRFCTWEYITTFDTLPTDNQILKQFELDFPQVDLSKVLLNLMVSFNSAEGRKLRFLVMVLESPVAENARICRRALPPQIWMFGWADEYMRRKSEDDGKGVCNGCFLFWKIQEGTLYLLVFFEGRLCHWSEEKGYEGSSSEIESLVEQRFVRFRTFLKEDDLFSRSASFREIAVMVPNGKKESEQSLYRRASRDSFWKNVNLACAGKKIVVSEKTGGRVVRIAALGMLFVMTLTLQYTRGALPRESEIMDGTFREVPIVELSAPPLFEIVENRAWPTYVPRKKKDCLLPKFQLHGIVAPQLFVVKMSENQRVESFKTGDSLGSFIVSGIGRDQIELVCNDSTVSVSAK